MRAEKVGQDSALQRMIRLVESADAGKARIVGVADRWATWIVVGALACAGGTWLVTGEVIRAVTILVVFCPCALVLATPTAIMAAIGNATRHGVLVRQGDALERLAAVRRLGLDKTGTLTHGTPRVVAVESFDPAMDAAALLALTAAAELRSEHPLGRAVVAHSRAQGPGAPAEPREFTMLPGRGVLAEVGGARVLAGNAQLLEEHGVTLPEAMAEAVRRHAREGATAIHVAVNGRATGIVALADTLREAAPAMIRGWKPWACPPCCSRATTSRPRTTWPGRRASPRSRPGACPRTSWPSSTTIRTAGSPWPCSATASTTPRPCAGPT
jgi:P-type E1-E2 ATPase